MLRTPSKGGGWQSSGLCFSPYGSSAIVVTQPTTSSFSSFDENVQISEIKSQRRSNKAGQLSTDFGDGADNGDDAGVTVFET
mmetsp:Transcript_10597/g.23739  ORF Transcript_10597/g.23739 Transcript_10597/m.23739 type:complete len:82 (+) Transcript_10597:424-669(+)